MKIIETNMSDGRDVVWEWDTVTEAWKSGRFDWIAACDSELFEELEAFPLDGNLEDFINLVDYPFYIDED